MFPKDSVLLFGSLELSFSVFSQSTMDSASCVRQTWCIWSSSPLLVGHGFLSTTRSQEILHCPFRCLRPRRPAFCSTADLSRFLLEKARCACGALVVSLSRQLSQSSQTPRFLFPSRVPLLRWRLILSPCGQMVPVKEVLGHFHLL